MVSSYLEQPLRSLAQALDDRAAARDGDYHVSEPGSIELLVSLVTENANHDGAAEAPAISSGAA